MRWRRKEEMEGEGGRGRRMMEKEKEELHLEVEAGDDHVSVGGDDGDVLTHDSLIHVNHVT